MLLDCPPSLGPLTVNALAAADRVIVPVQAEYYALEGLSQLMQSINLIRARLNPRLAIAGVLITMSDARTNLAADVEAEVRKHFGELVFRTVVPRSVRVAEAPSHGLPITHYDRRSPAPRRTGRWRWSLSNAANSRRGLGRGFEVLMGGSSPELAHVPIEQIHANPRQVRKRFEHEATAGLADSIRAQGMIQPVVLRPRAEGGYELIAGERRWRAAREAGMPTIPAVIREADDRETLLLGLVENVAREDLSPIEEARGYAMLMDEFWFALGEVSERVGRSKPAISNKLRLLDLPDDVLAMVERGELTEGHARAVLAVPDQVGRRKLARKIVAQGMSVRAAERAARWAGARTKPRTKTPVDPALAARVKEGLQRLTGLEARVAPGKIELAYEDEHDLEELADALDRI